MKRRIMPILIIRALAAMVATGAALFADGGTVVGIDAVASYDSVTVGDVVTMTVALKVPKNARIIPPEVSRDFGVFIVLSALDETVAGDDGDTVRYQYSLATFKPENCTIPSLTFLIGTDTLYDTLQTRPIPITVISVIPSDTPDSGLTIKDIKSQQKTGGADLRFLWALAAIALAVSAYFLLRKYVKKKSTLIAAAGLKPPYDEAIESIAALEGKKYLEQGAVREYTFELSEIFKRYIGRRYDTIASELTSEEIIAWFKTSPTGVDMRLCAERFFRASDQVKFAKWKPDQNTIGGFMKDVRAFLEATKPEQEHLNEPKTEKAQGAG